MATKLYMRRTARNVRGLANTKLSAAVTSIDAEPAAGVALRDLVREAKDKAVNGETISLTSLASTNPQHYRWAIFVSACIKSGDISAQTWTIALNPNENNAAANCFTVPILGIVKQDGTVRGYILDADTAAGSEYGTSQQGTVFTVTGAAVTGVTDSDRLFFEWIGKATQGNATARTMVNRWGGTTDPTDTVTNLDSAAYISTPQDVQFHPLRAAC